MNSRGFTLVEILVVVLILGILVAVAVPKFMSRESDAIDHGVRRSLAVIRDAIEHYRADHGQWPGKNGLEQTFKNAISPYLRSKFPRCSVGATNDNVDMHLTGPIVGSPTPLKGWRYYYKRGIFIINFDSPMQTDPGVSYDEL